MHFPSKKSGKLKPKPTPMRNLLRLPSVVPILWMVFQILILLLVIFSRLEMHILLRKRGAAIDEAKTDAETAFKIPPRMIAGEIDVR
ncbi:hypothetical protein BGZ57DRAFT_949912 [Hyaloscypha finlandica]|nr:hypothetical protein BGZ57DRAFT_949912 [Hyaloscypha finlandica]